MYTLSPRGTKWICRPVPPSPITIISDQTATVLLTNITVTSAPFDIPGIPAGELPVVQE